MQIDYDPQADVLYIHFRPGNVDGTQAVNKYIFVDVDENGLPPGLEILFASHVLANEELTSVTFNIGFPAPVAP